MQAPLRACTLSAAACTKEPLTPSTSWLFGLTTIIIMLFYRFISGAFKLLQRDICPQGTLALLF